MLSMNNNFPIPLGLKKVPAEDCRSRQGVLQTGAVPERPYVGEVREKHKKL